MCARDVMRNEDEGIAALRVHVVQDEEMYSTASHDENRERRGVRVKSSLRV